MEQERYIKESDLRNLISSQADCDFTKYANLLFEFLALCAKPSPYEFQEITPDNMPEIDELAWLTDGKYMWIGKKISYTTTHNKEVDTWVLCRPLEVIPIYENADRYYKMDFDDRYKNPTHFARLPKLNFKTKTNDKGNNPTSNGSGC